jgi:tetratricopeptide (TPR) repeat protein
MLAGVSAEGANEQGLAANRAGRTRAALSFFIQANALDPDNPNYLLSAGNMLLKLGQNGQACFWYKRALDLNLTCEQESMAREKLLQAKQSGIGDTANIIVPNIAKQESQVEEFWSKILPSLCGCGGRSRDDNMRTSTLRLESTAAAGDGATPDVVRLKAELDHRAENERRLMEEVSRLRHSMTQHDHPREQQRRSIDKLAADIRSSLEDDTETDLLSSEVARLGLIHVAPARIASPTAENNTTSAHQAALARWPLSKSGSTKSLASVETFGLMTPSDKENSSRRPSSTRGSNAGIPTPPTVISPID